MDAFSISDFDRGNVKAILNGHGNWFDADLLRLIARADSENRERLRLAFPSHVEAYEAWMRGPE